MAMQALLHIVGVNEDFTIVEYEHRLQRFISNNGSPISGPYGGIFTVTIVTPEKCYPINEWMLGTKESRDGSIQLVLNANKKKSSYKIIHFEDAFCTAMFEYFNKEHKNNMMTTRITIHANFVYYVDGNGTSIGHDVKAQTEKSVPVGIGTNPNTRVRMKMVGE